MESDSQTKGWRDFRVAVHLWKQELMICESDEIVFIQGIIAFASASLGNDVPPSLCRRVLFTLCTCGNVSKLDFNFLQFFCHQRRGGHVH